MRKFAALLTGTTLAVGLALASGSAFAADLAPAPPEAVPPAPPEAAGSYVSVFGGYALSNTVTGNYTTNDATFNAPGNGGYVIGGAIGTHLMPNLRGEVELSYVSHGSSGVIDTTTVSGGTDSFPASGSANTLYLLGNLWFDIDTGSSITPYLGGGAGVAVMMPNISYPGGTFETDAAAFAGQLGAGIKFQIADNMSLDLGYRAKGVFNGALTGTGTDGNLTNVHYVDQTVQIGLDIGF